jgi:hypothetical protein
MELNHRHRVQSAVYWPLYEAGRLVCVAGFDPAAPPFRGVYSTGLSYTQTIGAHGRIRTRIYRPVTFVLLRRQEGYVCMAEPAGIDPAPCG